MRDQTAAGSEDQVVTVVAPQFAELRSEPRDARPLEADQVACRTITSVISPGTELAWNYLSDRQPSVPGYANVSRVEAVGAGVTQFKPGDVVFSFYPHRLNIRGRESEMIRIPDGLDPRVAPIARLMAVSMSTLTTTRARPPQTVLVFGLGPVGHLAAKNFAACGYDVIAVDPVAARREILANVRGIRKVLEKAP